MNMYVSQGGKDFRVATFNGTFNGNPFSTTIVIDQFLKNAQAVAEYFTAQPYFTARNAIMKYVAPPSYLDVF